MIERPPYSDGLPDTSLYADEQLEDLIQKLNAGAEKAVDTCVALSTSTDELRCFEALHESLIERYHRNLRKCFGVQWLLPQFFPHCVQGRLTIAKWAHYVDGIASTLRSAAPVLR